MNELRKAAQQALEALDEASGNIYPERSYADELENTIFAATTALRAALAQPERKPLTEEELVQVHPDGTETWTIPPQRQPLRTVIYACPICAASLERQE